MLLRSFWVVVRGRVASWPGLSNFQSCGADVHLDTSHSRNRPASVAKFHLLCKHLDAFTYQIFPARATPTLPSTDPGYIGALLYHMALPLITIVLIGFGSWAYLVRNFMVGTMQEDFIIAKKTIGINKKKIIYKHALKNAAPPIITILALSLSGSLGGAIITEAVFDWPGMGRLYFEAISVMDLPVIIGATYVLTVLFLISIFVADLLYGYFDPRVKTE